MNEFCSLRGHDDGDTSKDPATDSLLLRLHLEVGREDVSGTTRCRHVDGAFVDGDGLLLFTWDSRHMNNGQNWMKLLELHVDEVTLLFAAAHFPASTFKEETGDVGALSSEIWEVLYCEAVLDFSAEADAVKREVLSTGSDLHDSGQVRHGVEETRDPQDGRSLDVIGPLDELVHTIKLFYVPLGKRLLRWVGVRGPLWWQDVDLESDLEHFHSVSDVESTIETLVKLSEREPDLVEELVHLLALLDSDNHVRSLLLDAHLDVDHVEAGRQVLKVVGDKEADTRFAALGARGGT